MRRDAARTIEACRRPRTSSPDGRDVMRQHAAHAFASAEMTAIIRTADAAARARMIAARDEGHYSDGR